MMNTPMDRIELFSLGSIQMRTFHLTWLMFFVCFFGWFGLAPLMPIIRADLGLTKVQVGNIIIASVSSTIISRLIIGRCCDIWGPRLTAVWLLLIGSIPVLLVGLARDYTSFLLFRLAIGVIGASFVITQFHMSLMFASAVKGTAGAITGGWGNLGGGVTNMLMPVIFAAIVGFGYTPHLAWRYAMVVPALMMWLIAFLYYRYTEDTPAGNFSQIDRGVKTGPGGGQGNEASPGRGSGWLAALADWRILALTLAYAVCFGMEIAFDNVASLYFVDNFHLSTGRAGLWAGVFGAMNLFARALGGILSDKAGFRWGMRGKGFLLAVVLFLEGLALLAFARAELLTLAIGFMLLFALFLKMANGAVYGIVPFINERRTGMIAGVVGAGGNLGGMIFGFLFRSASFRYAEAFGAIGMAAVGVAVFVSCVRWAPDEQRVIVVDAAPAVEGAATATA
jgi:NNP family nitrate/nitrite transporter-like MFS transporter